MSNVTDNSLKQVLVEKLSAEYVQAIDTSNGCGQSFEVIIVSPIFEGKTLLQKHQLVNEAAKSEIAHLHAFSQKTYTPAQWKELQK